MPVSPVNDGDPITSAWGDSVSSSIAALEAAAGAGVPPDVVQFFTASGVWNKPAQARAVEVFVIGGGGGGGGCSATGSGEQAAGGGGGGGAGARTFYAASALAASETITVGAAGSATAGADGGAGGESSFATGKGYVSTAGGGRAARTAWTRRPPRAPRAATAAPRRGEPST